MSATEVTASDSRPRRRWFRFSLRTLFVLLTILCIWLGVLVLRARNQQRAVQAITAAGGWVLYDAGMGESYWSMLPAERPGFKRLHSIIPSRLSLRVRGWLRPMFGTHFVDNVVTIGFRVNEPKAANREYIRQQVRDGKIASIDEFQDFASLPYPPLTDEHWSWIKQISTIEEININDMITDREMKHVGKLPGLRVVMGLTDQITDAGYIELAAARNLEFLDLKARGRNLTTDALRGLSGLPNLYTLGLWSGAVITDAEAAILGSLPSLERIAGGTVQITDVGLEYFSRATKLRRLDLTNNEITDAGLRHLSNMSALEELNLKGTQITDAGLMQLASLRQLTSLNVADTLITAAGVARLQEALPACTITR
jgi:hypothetical protein